MDGNRLRMLVTDYVMLVDVDVVVDVNGLLHMHTFLI